MPPTGVLLTGGTGFVGAQLLARYLERSDGTIYALVRADDREAGEARLREKLSALIEPDAGGERLVAGPGGIAAPRPGGSGGGRGPPAREALRADRARRGR